MGDEITKKDRTSELVIGLRNFDLENSGYLAEHYIKDEIDNCLSSNRNKGGISKR